MDEFFRKFSIKMAEITGSSKAFLLAVLVIMIWAVSGPFFDFSEVWQLIINTGTTIVTFLLIFLIQNTQNRDAKAIHLKLDELIRAVEGARNGLVNLEQLSDQELQGLQEEFERVCGGRLERLVEQEVEEELDERGLTAKQPAQRRSAASSARSTTRAVSR